MKKFSAITDSTAATAGSPKNLAAGSLSTSTSTPSVQAMTSATAIADRSFSRVSSRSWIKYSLTPKSRSSAAMAENAAQTEYTPTSAGVNSRARMSVVARPTMNPA